MFALFVYVYTLASILFMLFICLHYRCHNYIHSGVIWICHNLVFKIPWILYATRSHPWIHFFILGFSVSQLRHVETSGWEIYTWDLVAYLYGCSQFLTYRIAFGDGTLSSDSLTGLHLYLHKIWRDVLSH